MTNHSAFFRCIALGLCLLIALSVAPHRQPVSVVSAQSQPNCALPRFQTPSAINNLLVQPVAADFTGDGLVDLVSITAASITIQRGDGSGGFTSGDSFANPNLSIPSDVPSRYEVPHVHTADFNGDGRPDLLFYEELSIFSTPSVGSRSLKLWLGTRDGKLTLDSSVAGNTGAAGVSVADFNNDMRADVVALSYDRKSYALYLGAGQNILTAAATLTVSLPSASRIVADDINLDGAFDLVIAQEDPGKLFVALGNGNGTFQAPNEFFATRSRILSVAVADYNQTGRRDFVVLTGFSPNLSDPNQYSYSLLILSSNGSGSYNVKQALAKVYFGKILPLVDLSGDGKLDIVLQNTRATDNGITFPCALALNDGAGGTCPLVDYSALQEAQLLADLNRDNRPDIVTNRNIRLNAGENLNPPLPTIFATTATINVTEGNQHYVDAITVNDTTTTSPTLRVDIVFPGIETISSFVTSDRRANASVSFVAKCGIATGTQTAQLRVTNQLGLSATTPITLQINPATAEQAPVIEFVNGPPALPALMDGQPVNFAIYPPNLPRLPGALGSMAYRWNSDQGRRKAIVRAFVDGTEVPLSIYNVQPDGSIPPSNINYLVSFVARQGMRNLRISLRANDCPVTEKTVNIPLTVTGLSPQCPYPNLTAGRAYETAGIFTVMAQGDFNGDRISDVAAYEPTTRQLKTFLGQANGTLLPAGTITTRPAVFSLVAADFTRDGKLDLALSSYDERASPSAIQRGVTVLAGSGNGTFTIHREYALGHGSLATGDLNQDGSPDLVVSEISSFHSGLYVLLNNGQGQFTVRPTIEPSGLHVALAHLNNDNFLDILTASREYGGNHYQGDGKGAFQYQGYGRDAFPYLTGDEGYALEFLHSGDFNGDGRIDLALSSVSQADLLTFNKYRFDFSHNGASFPGLNPRSVATADFNRDGKPDLALNTGQFLLTNAAGTYCALPKLIQQPALTEVAAGDFNGDGRPDLVGLGAQGGLHLFLNTANVISSLAVVSAASYNTTYPLAREQIVAAFGSGLAATTQTAATTNLPTTLAGTQVRVLDSLGVERLAPLFFVSPTQVNFLVPANTEFGPVQIAVSNNGALATNTTNSFRVGFNSPGLFTVNASGTGLAAAQVLRISSTGAQRYEPVARYDTVTNQFVAVPIDLSNPNEQTFLVLYGTGMRGPGLSCLPGSGLIGGLLAERLYVGPQGSLTGLDQVNLRLPRELIGRGEVEVVYSYYCNDTNTVRINIK